MRHLFVGLITGLCLITGSLRADVLELRADAWCPYNCVPNAPAEGYLIDMARRIFPAQGVEIEYILTPWSRALQMAETMPHVAAPGAYPSSSRSHVFAKEPAGYSVNAFVTRKDASWQFRGYDSLNQILLGVVGGYVYSDELTAFQKANPQNFKVLNGDDPLQRLLRMVSLGRIDAAIDDMNVMAHLLRQPALGADLVINSNLPNGEIISVAFSPAGQTGRRYAAMFSAGIRALRESGELQKILDKYGMQDWQANTRRLQSATGQ